VSSDFKCILECTGLIVHRIVAREIQKYVEEHKSRHKWLKGGVEFINEIPKSPSGKILRRLLRDREKAARKAKGAKL
jgi:acyl-coenzyme A synthetase/AMP-(fatty) acid ligase